MCYAYLSLESFEGAITNKVSMGFASTLSFEQNTYDGQFPVHDPVTNWDFYLNHVFTEYEK